MLVTHILVAAAKNANAAAIEAARQKANRIFAAVKKNPAMFEVYARDSSDDRQAAQNSGRLRWFKVNEMVTEFEVAAFALQNNEDISAPVKTDYGFHIIKRIDRKGAETDFAKSRDQIKKLIDKDARFEEAKKAYLRHAKAEANFVQYTENLVAWVSALDSTVLKASFKASMNNVNKTLFKLGDKTYTTNDFANYVELSQRTPSRRSYTNSQDIALRLFSLYVDKCVMDYAENNLEAKYADFKDLMKDYTDGMILFDLKEKNVWSRSATDTTGLKAFFQGHASEYVWGERLEANTYRCATNEMADEVIANIHPSFFKKIFAKKKIMSVEQMKLKYNTTDHPIDFSMDAGKYERGNNAYVDSAKAKPGIYKVYGADGAYHIVQVKKVIPSTVKSFEEAKGYVIADYMANLEKTWMAALRDKYPVVENKSVVEALMKK
ncbi:MAG: peptidylprolyl isomerase [Chitinophagales bacterium]|nr:peptidylprolyl isomerase [Chitinophagales bacterium]